MHFNAVVFGFYALGFAVTSNQFQVTDGNNNNLQNLLSFHCF